MSSKDLDLVVLGEINPDVIVSDPDPSPRFGQTERLVRSITLTIGSSSAIFACGAARLGLRTALMGVVGSDWIGRFMLTALSERGVDVTLCVVHPSTPTGASVILSSPQDRAILTAMGTIGSLSREQVRFSALRRARHVHVGSYFLQDALRAHLPALFRKLRHEGITTSVDCNWDPREAWGGIHALVAESDVFFANSAEAKRITGAGDDEIALDRLNVGLTSQRPQREAACVVIKRGAAGAIARRGQEQTRTPALPVTPVDTTGAGDSFDAGFIYGWLEGRSLTDALRFGVVCGSLSTLGVGGTATQPGLEQALATLAEWKEI